MVATLYIFARARKTTQHVAGTTGKPSDDALAKIDVSHMGCVPAGIRYVTRLADMSNYLPRLVPGGLLRGNGNAICKTLVGSV